MHRRGYTLLELMVVLILIGLATAGGAVAFGAMGTKVDAAGAQHSVSVVLSAQQQRYTSRTAFTDSPTRLAELNPDVNFTEVANVEEDVSVALGDLDGTDAVAATSRSGDSCIGAIAVDPELNAEFVEVSWVRTPTARCTGAEAFNHVGAGGW